MPISKITATSVADNTLTTDQFSANAVHGVRNLIINGAMQVAQRGTSFSSISSDQYTLDRFLAFHTSVTPTITQESLSVGQTDLPSAFRSYLRFAAGTGAAFVGFGTRIEEVSKYYGTYKLSFYAKGTNPAGGSFQQRMIQRFGTGGSSQVITDNGTFTVTSSWQRFEIDVTVPSVSGKTIGTGSYLQFQFTQPSGDAGTSAWTLDITGVQLEVGDTATPFEHRSFAEEWDRCQRYCTVYNLGGGNTHPQNFIKNNHTVPGAAGHVDVPNRAEWFMSYPVKRAEPTITVTDATNMRWLGSGNLLKESSGSVTFPVGTSYEVANVFQACDATWATSVVPEGWVYKNSGTNPSITIDAEL